MSRLAKGGAAAAAVIALGVAFIGPKEGTRLTPYRDAGGVSTVCMGDTHVEMRRYTLAECKAMFAKALETEYGAHVEDCVKREMPLEVEVSFWSVAYNTGWQGFCLSRIVTLYNAGRAREACDAIAGYKVSQRGVGVLSGLVKRRQDERALCIQGLTGAAP